MIIPLDTSFLFACGEHGVILDGGLGAPHGPKLKHPTIHATGVWVFDLTEMQCPSAKPENPQNGSWAPCRSTWEARA